jgi:predicted extracellular nuclease
MRAHALLLSFFALNCAHSVVPNSGGDPSTQSVASLRDPSSGNHAAYDSVVTISGAVVTDLKTAGKTHGFFVQDPSGSSWAGVYVFVGTGDVGVAIGDVVSVSGTYQSYAGLDEIDVQAGSVSVTDHASVPSPVDVSPSDIIDGASHQLEWQSLLLRVHDVTIVTGSVQTDAFTVQDKSAAQLVVTSYVMNDTGPMPFDAIAGDKLASIVGHGYAHDGASLAPGAAGDLVH